MQDTNIRTSEHPHTHTDVMPKIVKIGSGRLKTDISVEIWKSKIFMITILPLYKEVKNSNVVLSAVFSLVPSICPYKELVFYILLPCIKEVL
ncbi:hypothetical protein O3M35_001041 [Rhynocoris fuscipes]|uniref:Uncharacterized protein n=1 Tax=Rhynocoris fuscipes TaxID=488301 RepID=A0AAW1DT53_9HEMI